MYHKYDMESNDELKEIDIKNHTCYYFDEMVKIESFNLDNILIDEKSYESILVYNISYKTLIDAKSYGTRYLVLFGIEKKNDYNRIRYLITVKSGIIYVISHNYAKIKVDSYNSLPLEKVMTFYNVIILIKSVWNKD